MKKPVCLCCFRDGPEHEGHQLFQPHEQHPCAWVDRACVMAYLQRHLKPKGTDLVPEMVCVVCEVTVPGETLSALHFDPRNPRTVFWTHPECIWETNYDGSRQDP
jgi:hypothetical protein